jgi:hypothetical protein
MKSIVEDYLQHRLPANQRFIQHINGEVSTYLIMYLSTLFPDSGNKAYILSGLNKEVIGSNINFSEGIIFYDNEIFYVPSFTTSVGSQPGLVKQTTFDNEEYGNGTVLPAYENRQLIWSGSVGTTDPLLYDNLVRRDCFKREIALTGPYTKKEGKIIANHSMQSLVVHVKLNVLQCSLSSNPAIFLTGYEKQGFLGIGKLISRINSESVDVIVYQLGENTVLTKGPDPITTTGALKWFELITLANPSMGNDLELYINLTHERV